VLIAPGYVGICGSDLHVYRGEFAGRVKFPLIQGHEFSGRVVDTGAEVRRVKPGDRVCVDPIISCHTCPACLKGQYNACRSLKLRGIDLDGGLAQLVVADQEQCFLLPDSITDRDAALVELYSIGMHAVTVSAIEPGDRVAVIGAGRVGLAVLQNLLLTAAGKVAAVDISPHKLEKARLAGAELTVDSRKTDPVSAVLDWTGGDGVDCVVECVGEAALDGIKDSKAPIAQAVEMIRNGGRITLLGQGPHSYGAHWKTFVWKEATLRASRVSKGEFPRVVAAMADSRYKPELMVSAEYPLSDTAQAFELVDREPPDVVKVMVRVE
jgi:threonine dehydrogenase-like Zn-dependent dehydrogenase